jgi:PIN domain nuclease of toxin-antitoxin system
VLRPSAEHWLDVATTAEQVIIEPLSTSLCLESTRLPGEFHRDPADRLIVALARQLNVPLVTADAKLLSYGHVQSVAAER